MVTLRRLIVPVFGLIWSVLPGRLVAQRLPTETGPDAPRTTRTGPTRPTLRTPPSPPDGADQDASLGFGGQQCETCVAINPLDPQNIVCVSNNISSGTWHTAHYESQDGGKNWTSADLPLEPGFSFSGDPDITFTPSGIAVITCLQYYGAGGNAIYSYRSLDNGITWQPGVQVNLNSANDKVQVAADGSGGPYHGQLCAAWDRFGTMSGDTVFVARSNDDGQTWTGARRIDDVKGNAIAPDVAYGANSELWVMWADRGTLNVTVDHSADGGKTWGTDIVVSKYSQVPFVLPGSSFRIFDIFSIAADWTSGPYSGAVYIAWHDWHKTSPQNAELLCASSHDGGATWSKVLANAADTSFADQVFPHAVVDAKGTLNIDYYDRRLDPNNYLLWTWVSRSSDGGASFTEHRVSDAGWDHAATENGGYIGDYNGIDASAHEVRPCWTDGASGSQDVYCDAVNLDFYSDVSKLSAAAGGVVNFTIDVGPNLGGADYWLFGSLATTPGITFSNGVHLPLDYDALFVLTLQFANTASFSNTRGTLDPTGGAQARLDTQGAFDPALAGIDLFFSTLVLAPKPVFATNATRVSLVP